jgi:hypothetical protein
MAPRRIVTFNWVSADGYFAGADGDLHWVVPDEEQTRPVSANGAEHDSGCARSLQALIFASRMDGEIIQGARGVRSRPAARACKSPRNCRKAAAP